MITGDALGNDDVTDSGITVVEQSYRTLFTDNSRIFDVVGDPGAVTLDGLILTGGGTNGLYEGGGAVRSASATTDLIIQNSMISGNATRDSDSAGGAVYGGGTVSIIGSTVSDNQTSEDSGGGGGIFGRATVIVTNSTISGNATYGGDSPGGGIFSRGSVEITNSTIARNATIATYGGGGGIYARGDTTVVSSTITGNRTFYETSRGGGLQSSGDISITDSIILGNKAVYTYGDDIFGSTNRISFSGMNIVGVNANAFNLDLAAPDQIGITVRNARAQEVFAETESASRTRFGVLADNGGPVQTIALKADLTNPALDAANSVGVDARGLPRGADVRFLDNGGTSDLGAFELQEQLSLALTDGDDNLTGDGRRDIVSTGDGNDTVQGQGGDDSIRGEAGADDLRGGANDDVLRGNKGMDTLDGGDGDDQVFGGRGADMVLGGDGDDILLGRGGRDTLSGNAGDDTLQGNRGDDVLEGGDGADTFSFKRNDGDDIILDFTDGEDRIEIRNGADSLGDLGIVAAGANVIISLKGTTIQVNNATVDQFDETDFLF